MYTYTTQPEGRGMIGHSRPIAYGPRALERPRAIRDWSGMADHAQPEVWVVVSTCTTQNSCFRFVIFHDDEGWAILEHSWLHQQSWLTSTARKHRSWWSLQLLLVISRRFFEGKFQLMELIFFFDVEDCRHSGSLGTCACGLLVLLGSFVALRGHTHACRALFGIATWTLNPLCSFVSLFSLSFDLSQRPVWSSHGTGLFLI